jgi:hypothetical protein
MGALNESVPFFTFVKKHHTKPIFQQDLLDIGDYKNRLMDYFLYGKDDKGNPPSAYKKQRLLEEIRRTDAWLKKATENFVHSPHSKNIFE